MVCWQLLWVFGSNSQNEQVYATDKRCTALKIALEKKSAEAIPEIKFVGGGISGNKKLMGDTLKQFYNSVQMILGS